MVFEILISGMEILFSPLTFMPPFISIFFISLILTFLVFLVNLRTTRGKYLKELKKRIEEIRENLTKAQKERNQKKMEEFFQELLKLNKEYLKHSFKAIFISFVIIITILPWLQFKYEGMVIATLPFSLPFIGQKMNWMGWYLLVSFTVAWIIRNLIGED